MHHLTKYTLVILMTVLTLPLTTMTCRADDSDCLECHDEVQEIINERYYVHEPVRGKKCRICHAKQDYEPPVATAQPEPDNNYVVAYKQSSGSDKEQPIKWLVENFTPALHQSALIKQRKLKDRLVLDLWYKQGGKKTHQYNTPDLSTLETQNPHFQMLAIDNLCLTNFDTRLVPRATLHWTTNEPSRCNTSYGNDSPDVVFEEDDLYLYDHYLDLRNFTEKGYVVEITCRDPYRRVKKTDQFNILSLPVLEQAPSLTTPDQEQVLLRNLQDKLWIEVITPQPASLSVGVQEVAALQKATEETAMPSIPTSMETGSETADGDEEHIQLNTMLYTTTEVCHKCHTGLEPGQSHPVNVLPPLNMNVPPEYRRLKNGKITCMTCHTVHGGDTEHRLIKKTPKALCTGCHTNY